MVGAIGRRQILAHPLVTIQCFGWRVFFKCMVAGRDRTFLSVLVEARVLAPRAADVPEFVRRCVALERRAMRIYESLARRFAHREGAQEFFETLARQEDDHAQLLEICRAAARGTRWDDSPFRSSPNLLPELESQMRQAESSLDSLGTVADALRLVIRIESSEINRVFLSVVSASDSGFVRALGVFSGTVQEHLAYIGRRVPQIEPDLAEVCRQLPGAGPR